MKKATTNRQVLSIVLTVIFLLSSAILFNQKAFASEDVQNTDTREIIYSDDSYNFSYEGEFYSFVRIVNEGINEDGTQTYVGARITCLDYEPQIYADLNKLEEELINNSTSKLSPLMASEEDISFLLEIIVGKTSVTPEIISKYDLYEDGEITMLDALTCCKQKVSIPFNNSTCLNLEQFKQLMSSIDDNYLEFDFQINIDRVSCSIVNIINKDDETTIISIETSDTTEGTVTNTETTVTTVSTEATTFTTVPTGTTTVSETTVTTIPTGTTTVSETTVTTIPTETTTVSETTVTTIPTETTTVSNTTVTTTETTVTTPTETTSVSETTETTTQTSETIYWNQDKVYNTNTINIEDLVSPYEVQISYDEYAGILQTVDLFGISNFKVVYSTTEIEYGLLLVNDDFAIMQDIPSWAFLQYCPISDYELFYPEYNEQNIWYCINLVWRPSIPDDQTTDSFRVNTILGEPVEKYWRLQYYWWIIPVDENGNEIYRNLYSEPLI